MLTIHLHIYNIYMYLSLQLIIPPYCLHIVSQTHPLKVFHLTSSFFFRFFYVLLETLEDDINNKKQSQNTTTAPAPSLESGGKGKTGGKKKGKKAK